MKTFRESSKNAWKVSQFDLFELFQSKSDEKNYKKPLENCSKNDMLTEKRTFQMESNKMFQKFDLKSYDKNTKTLKFHLKFVKKPKRTIWAHVSTE